MRALRKLAALAAVVASVHSAEALTYQYSVEKGRLVIQAAGAIEPGEGTRFLQFTEDLPPHLFALFDGHAVIVFDLPGGNLNASFVFASILSRYHLTTGVASGGQCASACVTAWAAGARKTITPDGRIGVHSATLNGFAIAGINSSVVERQYTGVMAEWLRRNGAPAMSSPKQTRPRRTACTG